MRIEDLATISLTAPSPELGYKYLHPETDERNEWIETLEGLHPSAWWVGLKFSTPESVRISVEIRDATGAYVFGPQYSTWNQLSNTLVQFPWPIPAAMADAIGICLHISTMEPPLWASRKIIFAEMPEENQHERFMFVNTLNQHIAHWYPVYEAAGTDSRGFPVEWNVAHRIVPMSTAVFQRSERPAAASTDVDF